MFVSGIFYDSVNVDFSVVLMFWLGTCLVRHHPLARKWSIAVCVMVLICIAIMIGAASAAGTDHMRVRVGSLKLDRPSLPVLISVGCAQAVLVGFPLWLLLTPQAKREFMPRPDCTQMANVDPIE
jgi:hypothetical protein